MQEPNSINTSVTPTWCPGCGNFGILTALKQAILELGLKPHETIIVSGIGCSGNYPNYIKTYGFHALHGRALPVATGIKLANHRLNVIAIGGDGDGYAIGTAHTIHTMRRNINITYLVCDNQVYGLTKGQTSPTSEKGYKSPSTPFGVIEKPINPLTVALSAEASFVARGYAGDIAHLKELIKKAVLHKGTALVDILQPCVSWNHINTYDYFTKKVYKLKKTYKTRDAAFKAAREWGKRIPIGVFYQEQKPTYESQCPAIKKNPLVDYDISNVSINKEFERYG